MSPDYFNECQTGELSVPLNQAGFQSAPDGQAYIGLVAKRSIAVAFQEYVYAELNSPLEQGKKYRVRFKASGADSVQYSSCCIGIVISNSTPSPPPYFTNQSSVELVLNEAEMIDLSTWHQLDTFYIAQGGESKIYLGNFRPDFYTNQVVVNVDANYDCSYMYIDDVEVYEDSLVTGLPENIEKETTIGYEAGAEALNVSIGGNAELRLMELTGKVVRVQQLERGTNSVPIVGVTYGVYVARVVYDSGQVVCKRVVVGR